NRSSHAREALRLRGHSRAVRHSQGSLGPGWPERSRAGHAACDRQRDHDRRHRSARGVRFRGTAGPRPGPTREATISHQTRPNTAGAARCCNGPAQRGSKTAAGRASQGLLVRAAPVGRKQRLEAGSTMFDTKIAIVVREDLATWQKLNVTAFLTSGVVGANPGLLGDRYEDAAGPPYNALVIQPMIVLSADAQTIKTIYQRAMQRGVRLSLYIEDMFSTGHDAANRAALKQYRPEAMNVVGLALREDKKLVDKITKGARMHFVTGPPDPLHCAKTLILLALPRGLRRPSEFNHLAKSGTHNRSTQSLGFLPPVSHLGRAVQLLASEDVAPSATVWLPITVFLAGHEDQLVCPIHPPPRAQTTPLLLQRAGRRERHRGCRRRDLATHRARPAVGAPRAFGFGPAAGRPL